MIWNSTQSAAARCSIAAVAGRLAFRNGTKTVHCRQGRPYQAWTVIGHELDVARFRTVSPLPLSVTLQRATGTAPNPFAAPKFTGATSNTVGVFGMAYESKTVEHLVSQTVTGSVSVSQVLVWIATQAWREGTLKLAVCSRQSLRWLLPCHPTEEAWQARGDQD